jgi:hypothetical protein
MSAAAFGKNGSDPTGWLAFRGSGLRRRFDVRMNFTPFRPPDCGLSDGDGELAASLLSGGLLPSTRTAIGPLPHVPSLAEGMVFVGAIPNAKVRPDVIVLGGTWAIQTVLYPGPH